MKHKITKTILLLTALLLGVFYCRICGYAQSDSVQDRMPHLVNDWLTEVNDPYICIDRTGLIDPHFGYCTFERYVLKGWGGYRTYEWWEPTYGMRAFIVNRNDVFSWEKITSKAYEELKPGYYNDLVDQLNTIMYLGIYTTGIGFGDDDDENERYPDPVFGWIKLKFKADGSFVLLNHAIGYKCKGIIVGTEELLVPTISYQVKGKTMTLTYSDSLYESEDGQTWIKVPDAEKDGTYTVDIPKSGKKLYCSIMDEVPSR